MVGAGSALARDSVVGPLFSRRNAEVSVALPPMGLAPLVAAPPYSLARNRLLGALPTADVERLAPRLEAQRLPSGAVLHEPGVAPEFAWYPTTAVVCLVYGAPNGASAEVAVVGNDGIVGRGLYMGGDSTPSRAVVEVGGWALRIRADALRAEFARGGAMQRLLLRHVQALLTQVALTAVCNARHSLEQRLCRWLLLSLDRMAAPELVLTQDFVAGLLGVRRVGVTEVAGRLERAGVIHHRRGLVVVVDRLGLESRACECYEVVRREYERLLPAARAERVGAAQARCGQGDAV